MEKWQDDVFGHPEAMTQLQAGLDILWDAWCSKFKFAVEAYRFDDVEEIEFERKGEDDAETPPTEVESLGC